MFNTVLLISSLGEKRSDSSLDVMSIDCSINRVSALDEHDCNKLHD